MFKYNFGKIVFEVTKKSTSEGKKRGFHGVKKKILTSLIGMASNPFKLSYNCLQLIHLPFYRNFDD